MSQSIVRQIKIILQEIEDILPSWKDGVEQRINDLKCEFVTAYPEQSEVVTDLIAKRANARGLMDAAYKEGRGNRRVSWEQLEAEAKGLAVPGLFAKMSDQRIRGKNGLEKFRLEHKQTSNGGPLSTVKPIATLTTSVRPLKGNLAVRSHPSAVHLVPNDIRSLEPQRAWILLLDETGSDFGAVRSASVGKFVGLLINKAQSGLQPIRAGWHAAEEGPTEIDRVFQEVLNAPCGVIGFPVTAIPKAQGERWLDGMRAVVDWVLRLMPLDGPTELDVVIEARPPFKAGMALDAIRRDAIALLARAWPERAAQITLRIFTETKDGHPLLPYVDALAYTWGSSYPSSSERLKLSGLVNTCLLNFSSTDLAACWDAWDQPGGLTPSYWVALVSAAESGDPASIASAILNALIEATRQDSVRWQRYLAEAQRHLFGGSFRLEQVGAMVDWLEQAKPPAQQIPDPLRLVWLTLNLARANHLGATEHEWLADLSRLSDRLYEEAAPLCCHADLHLSVAMTNRFDFAGAARAVASWHDQPPAVPGLRYWGQCRSTLGQHCAFMNDMRGAQNAFAEALSAFSRLSDPLIRKKEIDQTSCYAAIAAMDDDRLNDVDARAAVEKYLGNLAVAVDRLAGSDNSEHYQHHTLLRWIVSRKDYALGDAYTGLRRSWGSGFGHPWPLIEIYRAILIRTEDPDGAIEQVRTAAAIAFAAEQGPTVRLIGACCRAIGVAWGDPWAEKTAVLSELRESLPYARARIDCLELFMNERKPPLDILREVLPFNFH
jgi:hypothetical protein